MLVRGAFSCGSGNASDEAQYWSTRRRGQSPWTVEPCQTHRVDCRGLWIPSIAKGNLSMPTVAIAIFPGVQALDVAGPVDVFSEANRFIAPDDRYEVELLSAERAPLRASNGMTLVADTTFERARGPFDLALVAGGPALPHNPTVDARLLDWLTNVATRCGRYGSICTGAFVLGHAGLLDARNVTTHWQHAAQLAAQFPQARVDFDRIYLRDGPLVTSAGVTAGIDLSLALVAEDHGPHTALAVAKRLVVFAQRQGGQSQFSPYLTAPADDTSPVARVQAHVMERIRESFTVKQLADVAGMSARNFARVFVQKTGVTPHEFVERARVDAARKLLESSGAALKAIAYDCGFGTADRMRIVFTRRIGVTPMQYRERFRST
jgi:transcriptional regulator GlxA family with amidase domain